MMDFKSRQGRKFANMQDVAAAAGEHWERMSAEQRKPYEQQAKNSKHGQKVIKYTTTGQNIEHIQKRDNDLVVKQQRMKDNIESTIRVAAETGRIADEMFYFIHVNYFCYCTNKQYYPAEIAVARFTLREGVTPDNVFHMMCKPGSLPLGYSAQAKIISEETHQIITPIGCDDENNMFQVIDSFMKFMTELKSDKYKMPPVYAIAKNMPVVENVLQNFCAESGHQEDLFQVYSMEHLFYVLRNSVAEKVVWPVISMSILELEKDIYDFCHEIPCSFHDNSDVPNHCSRSHVIRSAFIVCDNCCGDLEIELIPGQHVPRQAKIAVSRPPSRASTSSSYMSTNQKPSHQHQPFLYTPRDSDLSEMSETSTVVDPKDFAALGGFDSEFSQTDADDWVQPKNRHRKHQESRNRNSTTMSQSSLNSSKPMSELEFYTASEGGMSETNDKPEDKQPLRRPMTLSAAITGLSQMSLSDSPGLSGNWPKIGRGRGRGIGASFPNKKT